MGRILTCYLSGTQKYGSTTFTDIISIVTEVFHKFDIKVCHVESAIQFTFEVTNEDNYGISPDDVIYVLNRIREFVSFDVIYVGITYMTYSETVGAGKGIGMIDFTPDTDDIDAQIYSYLDE